MALSACGGGSKAATHSPPPSPITPQTAVQQHALSMAIFHQLRWFTPRARFFVQYGSPASGAPPNITPLCSTVAAAQRRAEARSKGCVGSKGEQARLMSQSQCYYYNVVGSVPGKSRMRVCFQSDKLVSVVFMSA